MKTIVQINSVVNKGSTGKICQGIGSLAKDNSWDSYVAFGRRSNPSDLKTYFIGSTLEFVSHLGVSLLFDAHGRASRKSTLKFCNWLENKSPDVVHLHNIHGYYLHIPTLISYLKRKKVPVVWTLHDCWSFTGHCSHYSDIDCQKWMTECHNCPKKKNYPKSLFIDNSTNNYRWKKKLFSGWKQLEVVTVSKWLENEVRKSFLKHESIRTIYNGVDQKIFHSSHDVTNINEKYNLANKFVALAAATAWVESKGLKDYLNLANHLKDDEVIVLIGLDPDTIKELPKGIIGLQKTENQTELAEWYTRANVVLNLSTQESFGMTSIEGFACGTPSIVYNSTASPELVDQSTGVVVEPHAVSDVYDNMVKIKNGQLGITKEKCIERATNNFDSINQFNKYIDLYDSLL